MSVVPKSVVHLLSGGLDSTVLLYELKHKEHDVHCLLFDYGQIHGVELRYARKHCEYLSVPYTVVELMKVKNLFQRCALTGTGDSNIVPNRNGVMLNIAAAFAMSSGVEAVTIACNLDDCSDFPDCTPAFITNLNIVLSLAGVPVTAHTPYAQLTKREIVMRAKEIGAPYTDTMSCYEGTDCGHCDACMKRKAAICGQ